MICGIDTQIMSGTKSPSERPLVPDKSILGFTNDYGGLEMFECYYNKEKERWEKWTGQTWQETNLVCWVDVGVEAIMKNIEKRYPS